MKITQFESYEAMSDAAFGWLMKVLSDKPNALICTATGSSPTGLYQRMADYAADNPDFFSQLSVVQLDEWVGLGPQDEGSCGQYLDQHLIQPLRITSDRYFPFDGLAADSPQECDKMRETLDQQGPIDICILGVGKNGHLGLNEPASSLQPRCHVSRLESVTQQHGMVQNMKTKPTLGMTLGMEDILSSQYLLVLLTGSGKEESFKKLKEGQVTDEWPVTHILNHLNADFLVYLN